MSRTTNGYVGAGPWLLDLMHGCERMKFARSSRVRRLSEHRVRGAEVPGETRRAVVPPGSAGMIRQAVCMYLPWWACHIKRVDPGLRAGGVGAKPDKHIVVEGMARYS